MPEFVLICEYRGSRVSDPLEQFPNIEVVGPFSYEEAIHYESEHRWETCVTHSVVPLIDPVPSA